LEAPEHQLDFPVLYTNAKAGIAMTDPEGRGHDLGPLFETILTAIPAPAWDPLAPLQFLVTNLDYNDYVGRLAVGKLVSGTLRLGQEVALLKHGVLDSKATLSQVYSYEGLNRVSRETIEAGDIAAIAGGPDAFIGDTVGDLSDPRPLPTIIVEDPTLSMVFSVNTSPIAGREGKLLTSRHIKDRLDRELLYNVSIGVEETESRDAFRVSARGGLQLAVRGDMMRREGFELSLSKPKIITRTIDGQLMEPLELAVIDIPEAYVGVVTEKMGTRRGRMCKMVNHGSGRVRLEFAVPFRGLICFPRPIFDRPPRYRTLQYHAGRLHSLCRNHPEPAEWRSGGRSPRQGGVVRHFPPTATGDDLRESGGASLCRHDRGGKFPWGRSSGQYHQGEEADQYAGRRL